MSFDKCSELNVLVTLCNDIAFFRRQPPCFWWLFVGRNSNALTPTKPHNRFAGPTLQVGIWIFLHGNIPLKVAVVRQKSNDMFGYSFSTSRECTIPVISYLNLVPIGPCSQATGPSAMPGWIAEELGWLLPEPWDLAGGQCHWRPGSAVFLVFDCHGCTVMYQDIYIFLYIYWIWKFGLSLLSLPIYLPESAYLFVQSGWPSRGGWTMLWTPRYSRFAGTGPSKHKDNRCNTW